MGFGFFKIFKIVANPDFSKEKKLEKKSTIRERVEVGLGVNFCPHLLQKFSAMGISHIEQILF